MSVETVLGGVQLSTYEPVCEGGFPLQESGPVPPPFQMGGDLAPDRFRVLESLLSESVWSGWPNACLEGEVGSLGHRQRMRCDAGY